MPELTKKNCISCKKIIDTNTRECYPCYLRYLQRCYPEENIYENEIRSFARYIPSNVPLTTFEQ